MVTMFKLFHLNSPNFVLSNLYCVLYNLSQVSRLLKLIYILVLCRIDNKSSVVFACVTLCIQSHNVPWCIQKPQIILVTIQHCRASEAGRDSGFVTEHNGYVYACQPVSIQHCFGKVRIGFTVRQCKVIIARQVFVSPKVQLAVVIELYCRKLCFHIQILLPHDVTCAVQAYTRLDATLLAIASKLVDIFP